MAVTVRRAACHVGRIAGGTLLKMSIPEEYSQWINGRFQTMRATAWNQKTIEEFHAKKGLGVGMWGDHVVLMTAKGAKSGDLITTPLVCGRDGKDCVVVASKGGAPTDPTWFRNIKTNPEVELELPTDGGTEKFKARAHVVDDRAEHDRLYAAMTRIWPSFSDYESRTDPLTPAVGLERQRS